MTSATTEFLRQFLFLDSILAGFSFAIVAQLLLSKERSKATSRAITALIISSFLLLLGTFAQALLLAALGGQEAPASLAAIQRVVGLGVFVGMVSVLGLLALLVGLGLSGWIYSRRIGILSTVAMAISIVVVALLLVVSLSLNSS